jgi:hypothetical protein
MAVAVNECATAAITNPFSSGAERRQSIQFRNHGRGESREERVDPVAKDRKKKSVSIVELINPPITTLASGRCISAPVDVETAMGINPKLATKAVMSTGLSLLLAPLITDSRNGPPALRTSLTELMRTTPFSIATPNNATKPIDPERFGSCPRGRAFRAGVGRGRSNRGRQD